MNILELNRMYYENCLKTMAKMVSGSVDLIITSPPYDNLRTYLGFSFSFKKIAKEMARVLKPGGVIVWVVMDATKSGSETLTSCKQKIYFHEKCGLNIHDTMIYGKLNFSHPEKNRYHNTFEYVFIFSKGQPKTFNPIMDRQNKTAGAIGNLGVNTFTEKDGSKSERAKKLTKEWGMRHNIWIGKTRGQEEMCKKLKHPAMMPKWLARDQILSWSNEGDLVYDPMAGSGTVPQEAQKIKRNWIGSEMGKGYQ